MFHSIWLESVKGWEDDCRGKDPEMNVSAFPDPLTNYTIATSSLGNSKFIYTYIQSIHSFCLIKIIFDNFFLFFFMSFAVGFLEVKNKKKKIMLRASF